MKGSIKLLIFQSYLSSRISTSKVLCNLHRLKIKPRVMKNSNINKNDRRINKMSTFKLYADLEFLHNINYKGVHYCVIMYKTF